MSLFDSIEIPDLFGGAKEDNINPNKVNKNSNYINDESILENKKEIVELPELINGDLNNFFSVIFTRSNMIDLFIIIIIFVIIYIISSYYNFKFNNISRNLCLTLVWFALIVVAILKSSNLISIVYNDLI